MDQPDLDLMHHVDRHLDPTAPTAPLPPDLLARARRGRRRRTTTRALAATAAAVVVLATGVAVGQHPQPPSPGAVADDPTSTPPSLTPPDGMRYLGFEGVAVAVPTSWVSDPDTCRVGVTFQVRPAVKFMAPTGRRGCSSDGEVRATALPSASALDDFDGEAVRVNGLDVVRNDACPPRDDCVAILVPSLRVIVRASGDAAVVAAIADSVRAVPDGLVAVPPVQPGQDGRAAVRALEEAGLVADLPDGGVPLYVTGSDPMSTTLVARGSSVALLADDTAPSDPPPVPDGMVLLTYRGVSFAVPDTWSLADDDCRITNPGEAAPLYVHETGTAGVPCGARLLVAAYPFDSAVARSMYTPDPAELNGLEALRGSSCAPNAACIFATGIDVRIPDARVALLISGPPDQRALLEQIVSTIRPSTDG